ncbi:MAG: YihY/virulence factor BrkB family protein, partial [Bacteroidales bacterium]|nr:YihY/virulence factor BrkB family protein [Bacteroidales bacterium]
MSEKAKKEKKRNWLQDKLEAVKTWYRRDDNFLRIVRFPGTKLPLLDVAIDFFKLFIKGRTIDRAAGVAFNFILALAPLFLFLFTMIPIIPVPDLKFKVMDAINTFLIPSGTATFVTDTIDEIMNQPREG